MKTTAPKDLLALIQSKPTRCVRCSMVNAMTHPVGEDPKAGAWTCSKCGHRYPFAHWKIKKAGREKEAA